MATLVTMRSGALEFASPSPTPADGGSSGQWSDRLCGLQRRLALLLVAALIVAVIVGVVLGAYFGARSRHSNSDSTSGSGSISSSGSSSSPGTQPVSASALPYLRAQNASVVDSTGRSMRLRGVNVGGWLVTENWMCGIQDASDAAGRFALETLEARFGVEAAAVLIDAWRESWLTTADLDLLQSLNFTLLRVPFSFRNLQYENGSGSAAGGQLDFSRLDWIVAQAGQRGLYVVLDLHVWRGQGGDFITPDFGLYAQVPDNYSRISHNDPCDAVTAAACAADADCQPAYAAAASTACAAGIDGLCSSNFTADYLFVCEADHAEAVAQRAAAVALLAAVAAHYAGNSSLLAIDLINEPTGSYGNELWLALYAAVRQADPARLIVMELDGIDPAAYGWTNVVYSQHQYSAYEPAGSASLTDAQALAFNTQAASAYINATAAIALQSGYADQVPQYVGEFHLFVGGEDSWQTVAAMYGAENWLWTSWTYKTVDQGGWGIVQYSPPPAVVDVLHDDYVSILRAWTGLTANTTSVAYEMQALSQAAAPT